MTVEDAISFRASSGGSADIFVKSIDCDDRATPVESALATEGLGESHEVHVQKLSSAISAPDRPRVPRSACADGLWRRRWRPGLEHHESRHHRWTDRFGELGGDFHHWRRA